MVDETCVPNDFRQAYWQNVYDMTNFLTIRSDHDWECDSNLDRERRCDSKTLELDHSATWNKQYMHEYMLLK